LIAGAALPETFILNLNLSGQVVDGVPFFFVSQRADPRSDFISTPLPLVALHDMKEMV
jgi:hypothetical protein